MINLNKIIAFIATSILPIPVAYAGHVIIFDNPNLIGFRNGETVSGFYDAEDQKFSCFFLFFQDKKEPKAVNVNGYTDIKLLTFTPSEDSFEFSNRNRTYDIGGNLYRRENEWIIRTTTAQAGCENAMGTFTFDSDDFRAASYYVEQELPAIGIRLIKNKSNFYDYRGGKFVARKGYLTKWNGVVILRTLDQFSFVRSSTPGRTLKIQVESQPAGSAPLTSQTLSRQRANHDRSYPTRRRHRP
ncbi:hypothetical protein PQR02_21025 [Paraburkholderia sediminicola]|uniref:Uncharacterized protein n=1 Tax=Paraburkholderia rhynchosiae TaxID=487049 RepID=A0ACC7N9Z9_9BURK